MRIKDYSQNIFDINRRFSSQVWWTNKQRTRFLGLFDHIFRETKLEKMTDLPKHRLILPKSFFLHMFFFSLKVQFRQQSALYSLNVLYYQIFIVLTWCKGCPNQILLRKSFDAGCWRHKRFYRNELIQLYCLHEAKTAEFYRKVPNKPHMS